MIFVFTWISKWSQMVPDWSPDGAQIVSSTVPKCSQPIPENVSKAFLALSQMYSKTSIREMSPT